MSIEEITNKADWNPDTKEFLQSWEWGEFQAAVGNPPVRLNSNGRHVQGFVHKLPLKMAYVYWPRVEIDNWKIDIGNYLKRKGFLFSRVEPAHTVSSFRFPVSYVTCRQPQHTLMLDLTKSEEELLAGMHSKTRYNIRLAAKKGVEIKEGKDIDVFWKLNEETTKRDGFSSHGKKYYAKMLEMPIVHQLTAMYDGQPIVSHIYIGWNGRCTYLHGASSNQHRNIMAPYLLQWNSIQIAKKFGNTEYDFWGIAAPKEDGKQFHIHEWDESDKLNNVTRYKAGFGGYRVSYPDAFEVPLKPARYRLFRFAKKFL